MSKDERREEELPEAKLVLGNELLGGGKPRLLMVTSATSPTEQYIKDHMAGKYRMSMDDYLLRGSWKNALLSIKNPPMTYKYLKETIDSCDEYEKIALIHKFFRQPIDVLQPILKEDFVKLFNEIFNENKIIFLNEVLSLPDEILLTTFVNSSNTEFSANLDAVAHGTCGAPGGTLFQIFYSLLGKLDECSGGVILAILATKHRPAEFDHRELMSGPLTVNEKPTDPANDVTNLGGENPDQDN
jgi:hypothetical protein